MRHVVRALALGLLLVVWSSPVEAAASWFDAEVIRCGVRSDGLVIVRLRDRSEFPAFGTKNFVVPDLVSKEMLAIGLTAIATDTLVRVRTDPDEARRPEIRFMYLKAD